MKISEIKSNIANNYVYSLIEFNCEIIVDEQLIGKMIPINICKDIPFCLCLPKLKFDRQNKIYSVVSSLPFTTTNTDIDNWGRLLQYSTNNDGKIVNKLIAISSVWIVTNKSNIEWVKTLKDKSEWFIRCIHVLSPSSIILKGADTSKLVTGLSYSFFDTQTGRYRSSGFEVPLTIYPYNYYTIGIDTKLIKTIFKSWGKQVALPFELLLCAFQELQMNNYRNTILNCAMTIEVALKRLLRKSLLSMCLDDAMIEYLMKGADGLPKIETLMKLINLPRHNFSDIMNNIFKVRNKIIHGGYFPSSEQASTALNLTQSLLKDYNIEYFD